METNHIIALSLIAALFLGGTLYFALQPQEAAEQNHTCRDAVAAVPAVNGAVGIGMAAVAAACE